MRTLPLIAAACLLLPSCTTTGDPSFQKNLATACQALDTGHLAFAALALSGSVKQSTIDKEAAAYAGVRVICADPSNVTAANALVLVATAYATVAIALKEAKTHA
ncbi:cell wall anchor protein [Rhizobium sp. YJ-22]|uniref:cell wall anchor protein n=1 Tax=Rhizobium sp. YJ-22 TaxID=3037556 RepID=UPI0024125B05|nr:cell wall anchor protein [Rhizobium sp. YJ-22]MDG3577109.1 cell wall anchor protein [Rhizobium sp. YJ-22]